jgi:hypothetical protein
MAASKNLEITGLQFEHQRPSDSLVQVQVGSREII